MFCYVNWLTKERNPMSALTEVLAYPLLSIRVYTWCNLERHIHKETHAFLDGSTAHKTPAFLRLPSWWKPLPIPLAPLLVCFFFLLFLLKLHLLESAFAFLHSPQPAHALLSSKLCFLTSLGLLSSGFKSLFLNSSRFCVFFQSST